MEAVWNPVSVLEITHRSGAARQRAAPIFPPGAYSASLRPVKPASISTNRSASAVGVAPALAGT